MSVSDVQAVLKQIDEHLARLPVLEPVIEQSIQQLLNVVEQLVADKQALLEEVKRLQEQLDKKKKSKTTGEQDSNEKTSTNHSSQQQRQQRDKKKPRPASDRRTFKKLTVHQEKECPVDPQQLPPDAKRLDDEIVVIQNIKIEPCNMRFRRHVYYSSAEGKYYRGPLPKGFGPGDFGADLQSVIISLKYCGGMSEPKIREFLENFDVQISAGSVSRILTDQATLLKADVDDLFLAGLASTPYQQTDDTSARVAGEFWHTHIVCNPFYTAYFTRPHKDRLTILSVLQNQDTFRFRFHAETVKLLEQWKVPQKWRDRVTALGQDVELDAEALRVLLDDWFGAGGGGKTRGYVEQAGAMVFYRRQTAVPVVRTLVCDDAGQFKQITDSLALCWIHEGRHYAKFSPVVPRNATLLDAFSEQFWDYYAALQRYRDGPTPAAEERLREQFDTLFSQQTGYAALDDRIAKTAEKKEELLTVLLHPEVPLHNNTSELGARVSARRRDVSLHSRSVRGARAMDIFTTIVQTCKKQGLSAYAYLRDRLSQRYEMPSLANRILVAASD